MAARDGYSDRVCGLGRSRGAADAVPRRRRGAFTSGRWEISGPRRSGEGRTMLRYVSSQANSGHSQPPTAASGTRGRPFTSLLMAST